MVSVSGTGISISIPIPITKTTFVNVSDITISDEYKAIIRVYSETELNEFTDKIAKEGVLVPIELNEKLELLDGHHRLRASQKLGLTEIPAHIRKFVNKLEEREFLIILNLRRRDLNALERIQLAEKLAPIQSELARIRQLSGLKAGASKKEVLPSSSLVPIGTNEEKEKGRALDILARQARVSSMTYYRGKEILVKASSEQKERVLSGKESIDKAYRILKDQETKRRLILEAQELSYKLPSNCQLIHGDFTDELCYDDGRRRKIPANSVDLIFTDPPYGKEFFHLWEYLGKLAVRVLKPGGSLVTYVGHYGLLDVGKTLEQQGLKYIWILCVKHADGASAARLLNYHLCVTWKPLLWFVKGTTPKNIPGQYIEDFILSGVPDKSLHKWAQSPAEAEYIISRLTLENQVVLDPFLGSGTTGITALNLKRNFVGIEIDKKEFSGAQANIAKALYKGAVV